jgi:hypothetical protein
MFLLVATVGVRPQAPASAMQESSGSQFQAGAHRFTSDSVPDLSQLKADVTISTQASKLVDALDVDVRGMSGARMRKLGARPQDFVIGHGAKRKLYYDDLTILQWVQGYAAIMRREQDITVLRSMIAHLENLFKDAQYYGFPACMAAHSEILSDMEEDIYTWLDIQRLADNRRSNTQLFASDFPQEVKNFSGGQGAARQRQSGGQYRQSGVSGMSGTYSGTSAQGSSNFKNKNKPVKACALYNNRQCRYAEDHESSNTFWRHVCAHCFKEDHLDDVCPLLKPR